MLDKNGDLLKVGDRVQVSLFYKGKILQISPDEDAPEGSTTEYALVDCENGVLKVWSEEIKKDI